MRKPGITALDPGIDMKQFHEEEVDCLDTFVLYMLLFLLFRLNDVYNNVIPMLIIHEIFTKN